LLASVIALREQGDAQWEALCAHVECLMQDGYSQSMFVRISWVKPHNYF